MFYYAIPPHAMHLCTPRHAFVQQIFCIVMQMTQMNLGLATWDAMVIIPVFQSTWTMVSIVSGAIVYDEFKAFNHCPPAGDAICTQGGFGALFILALCSLPFALCSLPFALCSLLFALALCSCSCS